MKILCYILLVLTLLSCLALCATAVTPTAETTVSTHPAESASAQNDLVSNILFCVLSGVLAGGFTALGVALSYRRKKRGSSYPLDRYAKLNLTLREDRFVGSFVTRTRIQSNNSPRGKR